MRLQKTALSTNRICPRFLGTEMHHTLFVLTLIILFLFPFTANAQLDIGISKPNLEITTGFTGDTLTLFGTANPPGDIVILVKGPASHTTIHRKTNMAGIWVHGESVTFKDVPGYYMASSSRRILDTIPYDTRMNNRIGINSLSFISPKAISFDQQSRFQEALIQQMQLQGLYSLTTSNVDFINDNLFKTEIYMPANVPTGSYTIEAFLFNNGDLIDQSTMPFEVTQGGFAGTIHDFAYERPLLYGLTAIFVALFSSFLAVMLLRRE